MKKQCSIVIVGFVLLSCVFSAHAANVCSIRAFNRGWDDMEFEYVYFFWFSISTLETSETDQAALELVNEIASRKSASYCGDGATMWYDTCSDYDYGNEWEEYQCPSSTAKTCIAVTNWLNACTAAAWSCQNDKLWRLAVVDLPSAEEQWFYGRWEVECVDAVFLSSFKALPDDKKVTISWSTDAEIDNAGFNLYRSEAEGGEYVWINEALIPAQGSAAEGAAYEFVDEAVQNRTTYYYMLEDIDLNGVSTMHGTVSAVPRLLNR